MMNKIIEIALTQYGIKEIVGKNHNAAVVGYFKDIGFEQINDDETPWCSAFVNWCAMRAKYERTSNLTARSWLKIGVKIITPQLGDIVIFQRGSSSWMGHVGIYVNQDLDNIYVLSGNQSNMVNISAYPKNKLLGFRRLRKINNN